MRNFVLKIFLAVSIFLFIPFVAYAQEQFVVDVNVEYSITESGKMNVRHNVTIENLFSEFYAKNYILTLENIDPQSPTAREGIIPIKVTKDKLENTTTLKVEFENAVIGKGSKRNFVIDFEENSFVTKTGEVWEVTIPRLSNFDAFRSYNVTLLVPKTLGQEAYLSPEPATSVVTTTANVYTFTKDTVSKTGISAGFGEFQVFDFNLRYHLENPLTKNTTTEVPLPPDTAFQKVYYDDIKPKPNNMYVDVDGNWIAVYALETRERIDVEVKGSVQIFSDARLDAKFLPSQGVEANLKPSNYWQVDDPDIQALAKIYKTPRAIYDYVANSLTYDYSRVKPNIERLGAVRALKNPGSAICMEFTDLFIAIARAAGIPAREVNGYAYTENPEIEPLSLVADVLHAWPEYWDEARGVWIPVDPTWGSTTGGVDFFNKLDLRHFVFVIHGMDAEKPFPAGSYKLGSNPEKDVFVTFGKLTKNRVQNAKIHAEVKNKIPLLSPKLVVEIENVSGGAIYNTGMEVHFDNKKVSQSEVATLLPFTSQKSEIAIPYSLLALDNPEKIQIYFGSSFLEVSTQKTETIVYNLLAVLIFTFGIVFIVLLRLKKVRLPKNVFKIKKNQSDQIRN